MPALFFDKISLIFSLFFIPVFHRIWIDFLSFFSTNIRPSEKFMQGSVLIYMSHQTLALHKSLTHLNPIFFIL
jgi:hypothetical protein